MATVSTAVSIGMSVDAANKQRAAQKNAEAEAKKAMESARETIKQKKLAKLAINQLADDTAAEQAAVVAATGIDVARGGDPRQLAATIGRTQMANIAEQERLAIKRAGRIDQLELMKAQEEAKIRDELAGLDLAEAEGAQMAASDAAKMAAQYEQQAITAGVEGVGNVAQSAVAVGGSVQDANLASAKSSAETTMTEGVSQADPLGGTTTLTGLPALNVKYEQKIPVENRAKFNAAVDNATTLDEWLDAYYQAGGKSTDIFKQ